MMPRVSVVIPNYNHAAYLRQRLETVFNQDLPPYEVIVLDDTSTDHSLKVIEEYADKITHILVNETNSGSPFRQWKKGIDIASGDWIWIAESDDYSAPHFLSTLLREVPQKVGIAYAQTYDVRDGEIIVDRVKTTSEFEPNIWESDFQKDGKEFCTDYLSVKNVIPNASAVVFKKELAEGLISEEMCEMRMCGDWLFWVKLCAKTQISFKAEHLNYFRFHASSSRAHGSFDRIAGRIFEEVMVREKLAKYKVNQTIELAELLKKWFRIHKITQAFSSEFLKLNRSGLFSKMSSDFIRFKIMEKFGKTDESDSEKFDSLKL